MIKEMKVLPFTTIICLLLAALGLCRPAAAAAYVGKGLVPAIRNGDKATVRSLISAGSAVNVRAESGETPLMIAALDADAEMVRLLLKAGAEVNATNPAGATALMRAATDDAKAQLLIESGANVKARSALGNTALILASRRPGSIKTVKLLLEQGVDVNSANVFGATALMAAAAAEDLETVRLLIEKRADVNAKPNMDQDGFIMGGGRTALMWAAFRGNEALVRLLLSKGAKVNEFTLGGTALTQAAWAGNTDIARILLDAGAAVDQRDLIANYTPLHWAASSEKNDAALVELLLSRGADANAEGGQPVDGFLGVAQTPLMLARKRGETAISYALTKGGARKLPAKADKTPGKPARQVGVAIENATVADAVQRALAPLQKTGGESAATFLKHVSKQNCVSCHQQHLPLAAVSLARSRRFVADAAQSAKQVELVKGFSGHFQEIDFETTFHPEPGFGNGYALFAMQLAKQPAGPLTDAHVHQLAVIQSREGHWHWNLPRPPIQSSDVGATALAINALKAYPIPGRQREFNQRVQLARSWLAKVKPESNEERIYQLLGLAWAGERPGRLKAVIDDLLQQQRPDGGWGQLTTLPSDAFATGQALYALIQGAGLAPKHPAIQNGVRFLLKTQLEDGTWYARRRAFPFQPPMDSGFPHGADSWLSAAATSWAVMGLTVTLDPAQVPAAVAKIPAQAPATGSALVAAAATPVDFVRDIKPLLERSCVACHSGERPKGGYQLVNREAALKLGNRNEAAVVPGQGERSALLHLVSDQVEDLEMPPLGKREKFPALTNEEISRVRAWIDQGAAWPADTTLKPAGL